jgi:iron complex outermembrane receptor protein
MFFKKKVVFKVCIIAFIVMFMSGSIVFGKDEEAVKNKELDKITVTANKQEEDVRDVPITMSVFSDIDLEDKMIETVADIDKFTPGLQIVNYGTAVKWAPAMRGLFSDYSSRSASA